MSDIKTPLVDAVHAAEAKAGALASQGQDVAQGWLRRNVWGVVAVAAASLIIAGLALLLHG